MRMTKFLFCYMTIEVLYNTNIILLYLLLTSNGIVYLYFTIIVGTKNIININACKYMTTIVNDYLTCL